MNNIYTPDHRGHCVGDFDPIFDYGVPPNTTISQSREEKKEPSKCQGTKKDAGKLRFDILPAEALLEVVKVITYGENKYPSLTDSEGNTVLNWKKLSDPQNRFFSAGQRHMYADRIGEDTDEESGYYHLAHAISNLIFMLQLKIEEKKEYKV
jgi:hypothetical protein